MAKNTSISLMAFPILVHLLFFTLTPSSVTANEALIQNTCKNTPNYDLCVSTLKANPKSSTANVSELAYIVVNVVKDKSNVELKSVTEIAKSNTKVAPCVEAYKFVLNDLIPGVLTAPPKFAVDNMNSVAEEAKKCADIFEQNNLPPSANNKLVKDLSDVAVAILKMLL